MAFIDCSQSEELMVLMRTFHELFELAVCDFYLGR